MAYEYIKRMYGVDPQVGQRITHYGKPGQIVRPQGDPQYLRVRFDGQKHASNVHPTDEVDYSPGEAMTEEDRAIDYMERLYEGRA